MLCADKIFIFRFDYSCCRYDALETSSSSSIVPELTLHDLAFVIYSRRVDSRPRERTYVLVPRINQPNSQQHLYCIVSVMRSHRPKSIVGSIDRRRRRERAALVARTTHPTRTRWGMADDRGSEAVKIVRPFTPTHYTHGLHVEMKPKKKTKNTFNELWGRS